VTIADYSRCRPWVEELPGNSNIAFAFPSTLEVLGVGFSGLACRAGIHGAVVPPAHRAPKSYQRVDALVVSNIEVYPMNALAIANNDVAIVAWLCQEKIPGCLGFAVYRTDLSSGITAPLPAWVGFPGESNKNWQPRTTEQWPVQKFHWKDLTAKPGGLYQYRIVPMTGKPGSLQPAAAPVWETNPIHLTPDRGNVFTYFNRGILSTQALAHQLPQGNDARMFKVLRDRIDQPGDPLRSRLAGQIIEGVRGLLDRAASSGGHCYCALYELTDPELEKLLIGSPFVHVILSDAGTHDSTNTPARQALEEAHTDLVSRLMPTGHIGHNKFVVYADATGQPQAVLSGSTNWTDTGLCGQSNNAIVIENPELAAVYLDYWNRLKADTEAAGEVAHDLQASTFRKANQTPHDFHLAEDGSNLRVWFSPNTTQKSKTKNADAPVDLAEVFELIGGANQAVVFLAFQPGQPSILDAIVQAQAANANLFVRGAVTDPKAANDYSTQLFHLNGTKPDATVVPATAITDQFSFWEHELLKDPAGHAIIHDKIVVIDPFSPQCTVITGSHNLGYRASYNNDENMLIFTGRRKLAEAYAAHVLDVYDHYRFRFQVQKQGDKAWSGLAANDGWQDKYFVRNSPYVKEAAFWQAGLLPAALPVPTTRAIRGNGQGIPAQAKRAASGNGRRPVPHRTKVKQR
jgi:phosphatidylserine/phosphatidylglycerophosphate/cardiolipin synthase-like enzyme